MRSPTRVLLTVAMLCGTLTAFGEPSLARQLFVDRNDSGPLIFRTIQAALRAAIAGDTIVVKPGVYKERLRSVRAGFFNRPIILTGMKGAKIVAPEKYEDRLISLYHNNIHIRGFNISEGDILLFVFGARNVRISQNVFEDAAGECIRIKYNARSITVAGNVIRGCGKTGFVVGTSNKNGEGVYLGTAPEQLDKNAEEEVPPGFALGPPNDNPDVTSGIVVSDNTISVPSECVDIKEAATGNLIRRNRCSGNLDPESGGFSSRGNRNTFSANTMTGYLEGAGVRLGGDESYQGIYNNVINNVLMNTGGYAVKDVRSPQNRICGNRIGNNEAGPSKSGLNPSRACP